MPLPGDVFLGPESSAPLIEDDAVIGLDLPDQIHTHLEPDTSETSITFAVYRRDAFVHPQDHGTVRTAPSLGQGPPKNQRMHHRPSCGNLVEPKC